MNKADLARQLGVSRTYITLLFNGKRKPSQQLVNKISQLRLTHSDSNGPLAQLAEQLTLNQPVTGSSPVRLTKASKPPERYNFGGNQGVGS